MVEEVWVCYLSVDSSFLDGWTATIYLLLGRHFVFGRAQHGTAAVNCGSALRST